MNQETMRAMVLDSPGRPLRSAEVPRPVPGPGQVLVRVNACAVCRTDLHVVDGELTHPKLPLIPGHEVVGRVAGAGPKALRFKVGDRVGVPWLGWTCGVCSFCMSGRENLCDHALFTGYTLDGGFAEFMVADERFCFVLPDCYSDSAAAPLLCAGLIGYRCLRMAGSAKNVGIFGFGGAADIIAQVGLHQGRKIFAFTREGDVETQAFARSLGATWAGGSDERPPEPLDAAIIFAPVGALVPKALAATVKGGCVVCGGIHMSPVPEFSYDLLWGERTICSVANLTRQDGKRFLELAPTVPVRTEIRTFPLAEANEALAQLRAGAFRGSAVLVA